MQQRLQPTPKRNASIKVSINKIFANRERNASGLASFKRARAVVWTLWQFLTDLLVGFGHLLLLHLGLFFRLLGNRYRSYFLRSCMMQMYKCSCLGALQR
jgi:hypothetical protein